MFGYITPFTPELKVKDKELYQAYYCGLCRALGKYGLNSKLTLNYDAAFAAILLAGVTGEEPVLAPRGCPAHPVRGRIPVADGDKAIDYSAALSVLLAKYKILDDAKDGRPLRKAALPAFSRGVKRAAEKYPEADRALREGIKRLEVIEHKPECDPDEAPMDFGRTLGELLSAYPGLDAQSLPLVREMGEKLGGFVYITDAWDDRKDDKKRGSYNIFLRSDFENPRETCAAMLDMSINAAVLAYDLLDIKVNKPVLDNIMYMGLGVKAAEVLNKEEKK